MVVAGVGDRRVRTPLDWRAALLQSQVGSPMRVRVEESRGERVLTVTPTDLPSASAQKVDALQNLQLVTVTPAIRAERGISSERGALIVSLTDAARQVGFQEGDVILQINRLRVRSAEDAASLLQQLDRRGAVVFIERNGQIGSVQW
jgi:serine protease Do